MNYTQPYRRYLNNTSTGATMRQFFNFKIYTMQTEIIWASKKPTTTKKRLEAINGTGIAYITEKSNKMPEGQTFEEVDSFEELEIAAKAGKNVVYKTGTYSGRARFYVQK